ncbi:DUF3168 domain-containing protein [Sphingomonas sp. ABOLD]|uniref:DUF3168 domain-containing protein n=1 Tax=Sphingomonas trueperi TaxID=53317 RepID=A0A7X6BAW0_9SPHN|nr:MULTISPECIES: DUF3168 domain-containing protein [Sphingomonas]NJB95823.1 hypothetical protein [Sphingomonas trueperi]RSV49237.1 DUF3168 domain-containing protein [Sphingomonas sp. ABOLD]
MSPQEAITAAMRAVLTGTGALSAPVNGVFDAPPQRAVRPYLLVDEAILTDWSTKDQDGREVRTAVLVRDSGATRQRVRALAADVEAAIAAMPAALGGGWRIVSRVLVRTRVVDEGASGVTAVVEHRVRMLRGG